MELINNLIGTPLGYLMHWCYGLVGGYGLAIVLFTFLTKVILFPLSLIAQKNSIKMVYMKPVLDDIRAYNSGDGLRIAAETKALYRKEKYSTFTGILPLLIQIPIILGLIDVIYKPLRHLLRLNAPEISLLAARAAETLGISASALGYGAELRVIEAVRLAPEAFAGMDGVSGQILAQIARTNMDFAGFDLSQIPSFGSFSILMPALSGLSALALCVVQNKYNVLQVEQGFLGKWGMAIFLVAFSSYFAYILPCGLGLYWTAGNLLSIPVLALCNAFYSPKKYIDYENRPVREKPDRRAQSASQARKRQLALREKEDARRFFAADNKRQVVFYSEANGFYKYFERILLYITAHSDIVAHYVTSDPDDSIFATKNPQVKPYYIGGTALIKFMMEMDADIVVMTMPDLESFHIKRSLVRKDIEYIYTDHGMTSYHLMLREHALDHFDTIFVYGPNHIEEVRETERVYGLKPKTLVKTGFGLLDSLTEQFAAAGGDGVGATQGAKGDGDGNGDSVGNASGGGADNADGGGARGAAGAGAPDSARPGKKKILVAPSWQRDNIMDLCLDEVLSGLFVGGYDVTVRPHPEFVKRFPQKMRRISERYADRVGEDFRIETDFLSNASVYAADLVITDWSSIAQEFSYTTKKPCLFVNTPMKVINPAYERIPCVPLDISLRGELGVSVDPDALSRLPDAVADLLARSSEYRERIAQIVERNLFDVGRGGESGGEYIIARIREIEYLRRRAIEPTRKAGAE